MKKFLTAVAFFVLPLLLGIMVIFLVPINRKYAYSFVNKGGCEGRSSRLYQRIYEDTMPIDIAFIGTSHTMCGVNDSLIEKQLTDSLNQTVRCANLAYCGYGRNFDYLIVKDLLLHKKVKTLVLEIREEESTLGHGSFAHIASINDILTAPISYNRSYLPDIYHALLMRLQYLRESVTGENNRDVNIPESEFGYNKVNVTADSNALAERKKKIEAKGKPIFAFVDKGLQSVPLKYVQKIRRLCDEHSTQLLLLYLPEYGHFRTHEELQTEYAPYGPILFPPDSVLNNVSNWSDAGHLNGRGAEEVSEGIVRLWTGKN
jgi:hypothetical protein